MKYNGAAACVFCLAQRLWAAESTTVYQDQLDSVGQSCSGEISKASTRNIISVLYVVVKSQKLLSLLSSYLLVLMQTKCLIVVPR